MSNEITLLDTVEHFKSYLTDSEFVEFLCDEIAKAFHEENGGRVIFLKRYLDKAISQKGYY